MSKLSDFLAVREKQKHAAAHGTDIHAQLQHITLGDAARGNADLIEKIQKNPEIARFFTQSPGITIRTEVPIAGNIGGRFISRRIDRMIIGDDAIEFIDYKTDAVKDARRELYTAQLREYAELIRAAYPGRKVSGYILWLCDWELEQVV
ncbi:MAG: hypothetical protein FWG18_03165 [Alphaproteobacteria bacterium]|nr:hypothetical protein [Alphaproteobacteria bacterium]